MDTPPGERDANSDPSEPTGTARSRAEDTGRTSLRPTSWPRWYVLAWMGSALLVLCALAWIRLGLGGAWTTQVFTDGVVAFGAITAALALTRLATTPTTDLRRGWKFLAVGAWFEAAGELSWLTYSVLATDVPYPGLPDIFYLGGYPFLAAGFLLLAIDPRDTRPWVRFLLDGLVVGTALLTIAWHFALHPLVVTSPLGDLTTWLSVAYPTLDIVVAAIGFVVAINARGPRRIPLLLIASGILAWAVGDTTFAALEISGGYSYAELTLLWLVGDLIIALGALHPDAGADAIAGRRRHYEPLELSFPFIPFLVMVSLVAYLALMGDLETDDVLLGIFVILFLVARQVYISLEATRLSRELEANERTLARRNQELLLINRIVRHDIRNDMAVANGWAGELERHVDEDGEPMLERILATTQHTIDLTQTLRDFVAALEPGEEANLEPIPLVETLEETLVSRRETYPEATFTRGDIADVDVRANPLLATVFRNLLNNAVQHSDTDHPRIEIGAHTTDDTVQVRIADNGPGIPDDRKETIFHRETQGLDSAGSGIGLYLVDTLVTHYGGDVWVEDNEPRGAVFVVELQISS